MASTKRVIGIRDSEGSGKGKNRRWYRRKRLTPTEENNSHPGESDEQRTVNRPGEPDDIKKRIVKKSAFPHLRWHGSQETLIELIALQNTTHHKKIRPACLLEDSSPSDMQGCLDLIKGHQPAGTKVGANGQTQGLSPEARLAPEGILHARPAAPQA